MKFYLEIDLGNAAFDLIPDAELSRILRDLASRLSPYGGLMVKNEITGSLKDINGNTVGGWEVREGAVQ